MQTIPLTQGYVATVDDDDYEILSGLSWHVVIKGKNKYARTYHNGERTYMHQIIMRNVRKGEWEMRMEVDHVDRDGLNNQRANLRWVTNGQNKLNQALQSNNKSGVAGVHYDKITGFWNVYFKSKYRGRNKDKDAAIALRREIEAKEIDYGIHS